MQNLLLYGDYLASWQGKINAFQYEWSYTPPDKTAEFLIINQNICCGHSKNLLNEKTVLLSTQTQV